jgi:hypothetical protein
MRTLVAEDDRVASEALARTLKRWNGDVTVGADGAKAWGALQAASGPMRSSVTASARSVTSKLKSNWTPSP